MSFVMHRVGKGSVQNLPVESRSDNSEGHNMIVIILIKPLSTRHALLIETTYIYILNMIILNYFVLILRDKLTQIMPTT